MQVWLFIEERKKARFAEFRKTLFRECQKRGWQLVDAAIVKVVTTHGRVASLIASKDATGLYRMAHKTHVAVVATEAAEVCRRPYQLNALQANCLVALERFCRYKAFFIHRALERPHVVWMDEFVEWASVQRCDSDRDPRCLPLHVFESTGGEDALDTLTGRQQFDQRHGHAHSRLDARGWTWSLDRRGHGYEPCFVAGHQLPQGCHWDAMPPRGKRTLYTTAEEWEVLQYVNIYPNAHIRPTTASHARRVFPKR